MCISEAYNMHIYIYIIYMYIYVYILLVDNQILNCVELGY